MADSVGDKATWDTCRAIFMAGFAETERALSRGTDGDAACLVLTAGVRAGLELAAECCIALVFIDRHRCGAPQFASVAQMDAEEVQPLRRRLMEAVVKGLLDEKDAMQAEWARRSL